MLLVGDTALCTWHAGLPMCHATVGDNILSPPFVA